MPLLAAEPSLYPDDLFSPASMQSVGERSVDDRRWWAIYTISRCEKMLVRRLIQQQVACFCPIAKQTYRSPAGRQRHSYLPLFSNYVFLFGEDSARQVAWESGCVSRMLPVDDTAQLTRDLCQVHQLLETGVSVGVEPRLEPGTRVRVKHGALQGQVGRVFRRHGQSRLLVVVNFLQQGASVEVNDWDVERID